MHSCLQLSHSIFFPFMVQVSSQPTQNSIFFNYVFPLVCFGLTFLLRFQFASRCNGEKQKKLEPHGVRVVPYMCLSSGEEGESAEPIGLMLLCIAYASLQVLSHLLYSTSPFLPPAVVCCFPAKPHLCNFSFGGNLKVKLSPQSYLPTVSH